MLTNPFSSRSKVLYNPKTFITHAALLRQAFAHCARFPTAASRRSLGRVSVSIQAQEVAFAIGVLPDIYAFHRYTWSSASLYRSLVCQYRLQFPG